MGTNNCRVPPSLLSPSLVHSLVSPPLVISIMLKKILDLRSPHDPTVSSHHNLEHSIFKECSCHGWIWPWLKDRSTSCLKRVRCPQHKRQEDSRSCKQDCNEETGSVHVILTSLVLIHLTTNVMRMGECLEYVIYELRFGVKRLAKWRHWAME